MTRSHVLRWLLWAGIASACLLAVATLSSPLWLGPTIARQASAVLGRPVAVGRVVLRPGSPLTITADEVLVGNPPDFPTDEEPLLRLGRLAMQLEVGALLRRREVVIPSVELTRPVVRLVSLPDGRRNYGSELGSRLLETLAGSKIGPVRIQDGQARVSLADPQAELDLKIKTVEGSELGPNAIHAEARGTYTDEPTQATLLLGGGREWHEPSASWSFDLDLTNGPTRASANGLVQQPLKPRTAALDLSISGPDMARLAPLTGVSLPHTPPYDLRGKLHYLENRFQFNGISGRMGKSDVQGTLTVIKGRERPLITADLSSRSADLRDITSLITGEPGPPGTPGQTPEQQERAEQVSRAARSSSRLLPSKPINMQRLRRADTHLVYRAESIKGRSMPFDDLAMRLEIVDGAVALRPLSFKVGQGRISGDIQLSPKSEEAVNGRADIRFDRLDLARLMQTTGRHQGRGALSGTARVEGTGRSLAEILGNGDGALTLSMTDGDLSKLLVDLAGLRLGSALLTSLGGEQRTRVECFLADMELRRGRLSTRALLLETEDAVTQGQGAVDLKREQVQIRLRTESKRLTIGVLPTALLISGSLKAPNAAPARPEGTGGAIADLFSALPTVQLGIGDDPRCERLVRRARRG
ncbi:AsmA family protein [Roseomonas chloroacetimidivorans]|uniref:AsmA family protein n=1 Tax=Roseomonas chloroacetimidivorans TaxID=1766656 RepID=UPI003C71AAD5